MKKEKWNSRWIVLLLANGVLLAAFLIVSIAAHGPVKRLYSQREAQRWQTKKKPYAQVSAFISPEQNMQEEGITGIRSALMEKLSKDAYNEAEGNARVWVDGYSGECHTSVRKDTNTLSVTAVGVGGDFFQFHPSRLLSGSYISGDDLNHDRIVVDQGFAWAMFGSNDIVGMQVWMGDHICVIAGVVAVEEDSLTQTAYGNGNRIYMLYDELKLLQEDLKITCYEAVLPNPISNYACNALKSACGLTDEAEESLSKNENPLNFDTIEVIENSNRYETMTLLSNRKGLRLRSMRANSIGYPYWENVARVVEEQQMSLLAVRLLLLLLPCITLIWFLHHLWTHRSWTARDLMLWVVQKIQEKREAAEEERNPDIGGELDVDLDAQEEEGLDSDMDVEDASDAEEDADIGMEEALGAEEDADIGMEEALGAEEDADIDVEEMPDAEEDADIGMEETPGAEEDSDIDVDEASYTEEEVSGTTDEQKLDTDAEVQSKGKSKPDADRSAKAHRKAHSDQKVQDGNQTDTETHHKEKTGEEAGANGRNSRQRKRRSKNRRKGNRRTEKNAQNERKEERDVELYSVTNTDIFKT